MYVKRIDIFGFKTFADKTTIELSNGITCVVGPNGSGKSNIADALLWVLGENNVRNIRATYNADVIFNGTGKRRPLGFAEVTLTLDNSCKTLPLSFNEVTVTRRIYRSGDSEYMINGVKCRLKDIYELFLDTGIGREAYSFVTQGEIDAVLSVRPEERRELFEEAAGIKKYRYQRKEALKKLEKTQENLNRVTDIISELSTQIEPLKEQSELAKKYNELQIRLREIETSILIRDLKRFRDNLFEVRDEINETNEHTEKTDAEITACQEEKRKNSIGITDIETKTEKTRTAASIILTTLNDLKNKSTLLGERLVSLKANKLRLENERQLLESKIKSDSKKLLSQQNEKTQTDSELMRAEKILAEESKALAALDDEYNKINQLISGQKAGHLQLAQKTAQINTSIIASKTKLDSINIQLKKCFDDILLAKTSFEKNLNDQTRLDEEIKILEAAAQTIAQEITVFVSKRKQADSDAGSKRKERNLLSQEISSKSGRLSILKEMQDSHEGFFEGVRNVINGMRQGKIDGNFDVVADVLRVPEGYEIAIETALASSLQDIICDSIDNAREAIEYLRSIRGGRATFLPLKSMRPKHMDLKKSQGICGIASKIVDFDKCFTSAIETLLATTIVCETLDDATKASKEQKGWNKIVTLRGELIVPTGAITGGLRNSKNSGFLARKRDAEKLAGDIDALKSDEIKLGREINEIEEELLKVSQNIVENEKKLAQQRLDATTKKNNLLFINRELKRIESEQAELEKLKTNLSAAAESETAKLDNAQKEMDALSAENVTVSEHLAEAERNTEELLHKRDEKRESVMNLNTEAAILRQKKITLEASLSEFQHSVKESQRMLDLGDTNIVTYEADIKTLCERIETIESEKNQQQKLFDATNVTLNELTEERSRENTLISELDDKIYNLGRIKNDLLAKLHSLGIKEARLDLQLKQAAERLESEYDIALDDAFMYDTSDIERGTAGEVAQIRKEMRAMGNVNLGAIAQYEQMSERWEFLNTQYDDLTVSKSDVENIIYDIDRKTHSVFLTTFESVTKHFDTMFKRLFDGGQTEVKLTDPENLLETGIDIFVQIPGKKRQNMTLLSGGEKALTAMAFILALLKQRPSPFVVMDEVDASLDESNVSRFSDIINEFAENSQFIIITHNRMTMESADNLYGVAMEEAGVSKIISVKLS